MPDEKDKRKRTPSSRKKETPVEEVRRTKRRRRKKRGRVFWGFMILILILLCIGLVIVKTPLFNIEEINIEGNVLVSAEEILESCDLDKGQNILGKSSADCEEEILKLPYVHSVDVVKKYPSGITITIEEEYEFATVKLTGKSVICDRYGKSIRLSGEEENEKLVEFEGGHEGEFGLGEYIRLKSEEETEVMMRCLYCITDYEFLDVTKVDMTDSYNIVFTVGDSLIVKVGNLGDEDELSYKMAYIKEVIDSLPGNISGIIDATNLEAGISYRTGEYEYEPVTEEIENTEDGEIKEDVAEEVVSETLAEVIEATASSEEESGKTVENTEEI